MSTTTAEIDLATCPACSKAITGRVTYRIDLAETDSPAGERAATLVPIGVLVRHDCTPKVTRFEMISPGYGPGPSFPGAGLSAAQMASFERRADRD